MDKPILKISGKEYTPASPKMKTWRRVVEADKTEFEGDVPALMNWYIRGIVEIYDSPEITPDVVEENLDAADIIPIYRKAANWVALQIYERLETVPKTDAAEG